MMRFFKLFVLTVMPSFLLFSPVMAVDVLDKTCTEANVSNSSFCDNVKSEASKNRILGPDGIITKATQFLVFLTGAISLIMVLIGGFRYVASAGDANATKAGKETILYALIGLAIVIFAQIVVSFVLSKL